MLVAYKEAVKAKKKNEVPVGAIIVKDGKIIAKSHNKKEQKNDVTAHAEIIAIQKATKLLRSWRLNDCDMFVTLEPCCMCAGAILNARIKNLYIGTMDPKAGCVGSVINILDIEKFNHKVNINLGIMQNECSKILKDFFKEVRQKTILKL